MQNTNTEQDSPSKLPQSLLQVEQFQVSEVPQNTYKSSCKFMIMALVLSISSIEFGYALCEISTIPISEIKAVYGISLSDGVANGLLVGIMPIGGLLGSILNGFFLKCFTKKKMHYLVSALNVTSLILNQITTQPTIFLGRFILGICCGIYTSIASHYIKQITPFKLRPLFGSFFSMGRITGILFCYGLGTILSQFNVNEYYRIMFAIPGTLAIIQSILMFLIVPESPIDLLKNRDNQNLESYVVDHYHEEHHKTILTEYRVQHELMQKALVLDDTNNSYEIDPLQANKRRATIMAIYLSGYRQFIGGNTVIIFAGQMVAGMDPVIGPFINVIMNGIQWCTTAISTFWLGRVLGRRFMFMSSGIIMGACCYLISFGYIFSINYMIIIPMIIYLAIFGLLLAPVNWAYPAELLPPSQIIYAVSVSWVGLAITTIFPPIIMQVMNQDNYPTFLFFAIYTTFSLIYMGLRLVENKGLNYKQTIEKY